MAFLRQCLQAARSRSGDLEGWHDLMESSRALRATTDVHLLDQPGGLPSFDSGKAHHCNDLDR